jgi:hypothetical protein
MPIILPSYSVCVGRNNQRALRHTLQTIIRCNALRCAEGWRQSRRVPPASPLRGYRTLRELPFIKYPPQLHYRDIPAMRGVLRLRVYPSAY